MKFEKIPIQSRLPEIEIAMDASIKAGNVIMEIYGKEFSSKLKSDNSPITEADIKSNQIIKEILTNTDYPILSEEDNDNEMRLNHEKVWIVDPLDGTTDFVNRTGEFTVMIALVSNKKPILGVINWPTKNTLFVAQKGSGAFRFSNDQWTRIAVSKTNELKYSRVLGSRHHLSDEEKLLLKKLEISDFTSIGSSLKVGKISSGEADAYITTTDKMKEWDSCASYCIITEAGGKMTDMLGNDLSYNNKIVNHQNGLLVTNGLIHDKIIEEYRKLK